MVEYEHLFTFTVYGGFLFSLMNGITWDQLTLILSNIINNRSLNVAVNVNLFTTNNNKRKIIITDNRHFLTFHIFLIEFYGRQNINNYKLRRNYFKSLIRSKTPVSFRLSLNLPRWADISSLAFYCRTPCLLPGVSSKPVGRSILNNNSTNVFFSIFKDKFLFF